jgi:hypothetical protein
LRLSKTCEPEAGPFLAQIHADEQEAFIVAETYIISWPELLDQPALKQKRLGFTPYEVHLEIPNAFQQGARFQIGPHLSGGHEVV